MIMSFNNEINALIYTDVRLNIEFHNCSNFLFKKNICKTTGNNVSLSNETGWSDVIVKPTHILHVIKSTVDH